MLEDETEPADPVGVCRAVLEQVATKFPRLVSIAPVGEGRRGSESCRLLLDAKKGWSTRWYRTRHRIEPGKTPRCFGVGLLAPQINRPLVVGKKWFRVGRSTPQTERHYMVRERRGSTCLLKKATRRCRNLIAARRVPEGSARNVGFRAMIDRGGVSRAYSPCRIHAAVEGNDAESGGSLRRTQPMTEGNGSESVRPRDTKKRAG